jgi:MATE family multidrug resistance protein
LLPARGPKATVRTISFDNDKRVATGDAKGWLAEPAALFKLAVPLALTHLAQMAIGLTDTVMLGRYDKTALAASVLGNTVYLFCWFIGLGPASAVTPMIAQVLGARPDDRTETAAIVRMGLWSVVLMSIPLVGVLLLTDQILLSLGQKPDLAEAASRFAIPLAFGLPFALAFQVLRNFAVALSRPQPAFYVMTLTVLSNLAGDYVLIYGHFGLPRLGLVGSGIASACSLVLSFLAMAAAIALTPRLRGHRLAHRLGEPNGGKLAEIFRLGLPMSAMQILESGFYLAMHLVVGVFGAVTVAAHAIAWSVQTQTSMIPTGIGVAASVRMGLAAGAQDNVWIRRAGYSAIASTIVCMAVCGVAMAIFAREIAGLYLSDRPGDPLVIDTAIPLLWVAAAYQVADGVQATAVFALRGLKDVRVPTSIVAASFWIVGSIGCLGLAFGLDMKALGVWIGLAVTLFVLAAFLCARLHHLMQSK